MGDRPRIKMQLIGEAVIDELAYSENIGSKNAIKIIEKYEHIHIEVWYDKHYVNRVNFGDEYEKRKGIDEKTIQELVFSSLCHLKHYSFLIKNFAFVSSKQHHVHSLRIVLQKQTPDGMLNVAVGFYHIRDNKYEVTVFTAMVVDGFKISDGQYALLINEVESTLYKMSNKRLIEISRSP